MLEADAKTKLCPFKLGDGKGYGGPYADPVCEGSACMGWQVSYKRSVSTAPAMPKEPPQGFCGMIPPELNCNVG